MLYQWVNSGVCCECFMLACLVMCSIAQGVHIAWQDSLLFKSLFFSLFALCHRAKIPLWWCLTFFCP